MHLDPADMKDIIVIAVIKINRPGVLDAFVSMVERQRTGATMVRFPGGKVKEGESLKSALERELKEELGVVMAGGIGAPCLIAHQCTMAGGHGNVKDAKLLYYFSIDAGRKEGWLEAAGSVVILDGPAMERRAHQVPHDNYLIAMNRVPAQGEPLRIPPGFLNSPGPGETRVITFL